MCLGDFAVLIDTQRCDVTENDLVAVALHAFTLDCMYKIIKVCHSGGNRVNLWDTTFASLTGWVKESTPRGAFCSWELQPSWATGSSTCF